MLSCTQNNNTTSYIFEYIHHNHGLTSRLRQGWLTDCKDHEMVNVHPLSKHHKPNARWYTQTRDANYKSYKTAQIIAKKSRQFVRPKIETGNILHGLLQSCMQRFVSFLPMVEIESHVAAGDAEASSYSKFWLKWKAALEHTRSASVRAWSALTQRSVPNTAYNTLVRGC